MSDELHSEYNAQMLALRETADCIAILREQRIARAKRLGLCAEQETDGYDEVAIPAFGYADPVAAV